MMRQMPNPAYPDIRILRIEEYEEELLRHVRSNGKVDGSGKDSRNANSKCDTSSLEMRRFCY
jgi:hypothetical protein